MKKFITVILIIFISLACSSKPGERAFPQRGTYNPFERKSYPELNKSKIISNNTNIHYNTNYCIECHTKYPDNPELGKSNLKFKGDYKLLCKCHDERPARDLHPTDIIPSREIIARMPSGFPLLNEKITCSTCHDIYLQCKDIVEVTQKKERFLRGGPYNNISDQCFICHDPDKFKRYNPHKQLDKNGDILKGTCLHCHSEIPEVKNRESKEEIKLIGNRTALCKGCHLKNNLASLHDKHIRRPSAVVLIKIKESENKLNISLPLSEDGMVTCITCHNPHEKNLIPEYRSGVIDPEQGVGAGFSGEICIMCHEMR